MPHFALSRATRPGARTTLRTKLFAAGASAITVGALVAGATIVTSTSRDVALAADTVFNLTGHGYGHGRGMGQYGAFGYAKSGWQAGRILDYYYGGTTAGKVDSGTPIKVQLTQQRGVDVYADAGLKIGDVAVAPGQAVRLDGATATIRSGCGGATVRSVPGTTVGPINPGINRPAGELLKLCGSNQPFRGSLGLEDGKVINTLGVDDYVKGVVPKEISAGWADQGAAEALKAQAVAARSYVLSCLNSGRAVDDTQASQVYGGAGSEDPRTSAAVDATAGVVRNNRDGKPAFTEFSSSTGGFTAGVNFPAVVDDGDKTSPKHDWKASVSAAGIASAFKVGSLTSFRVSQANGLGAENGRVVQVTVVGTNGTVTATGEEARQALDLKSDWFAVDGQKDKPQIVAPPAGVAKPAAPRVPTAPDLLDIANKLITGRWKELGGPGGMLGKLLGPLQKLSSTTVRQQYANGSITYVDPPGKRKPVTKVDVRKRPR